MKFSKKDLDKIEETLIAAHRRQDDRDFSPDWRQKVMEEVRAQVWLAPAPRAPRRVLAWAAAAMAVIIGWGVLTNLDWYDPWIKITPVIIFVDSRANVSLEAGDQDSGLKHLTMNVIQADKATEVLSYEVKQPERFFGLIGPTTKKVGLTVLIDAKALNLRKGPAKIVIEARDLSWRNTFQGRLTTLEKDIVIKPDSSS
jgi:hypothetical protein